MCIRSVSLLDFTGPADGNGVGGGTDRTQAFASAYTQLAASGGGTLVVPFSGTGVYRVDGAIEPAANTSTIVDNAVTIDFSKRAPGGVNGHCILIAGSYAGGEKTLGTNVTRGEVRISTASAHGLGPGDWFLLKSQRNCLHADAGEDWRLGAPTGEPDSHALYFGEPCLVSRVLSATEVEVRRPLIFPDYRTDKLQETSVLARNSSTLEKFLFKENVHWRGGKFVNNGTTVFRLSVTRRCSIADVFGDMRGKPGALILNQNGLENKFLGVRAEHDAEYYIVEDHSRYNSFKELSSWWSTWDYEDRNGSQGFDGTYIVNTGTPSIGPVITGSSYDSHEQALTFHAGTYGFMLKNIRSYRAKQNALTIRSRFGIIDSPMIFGPNTNLLGAVQFTGWGVDCSVLGGMIEGYVAGVTIGPDTGPQPVKKNITVDGVSIRRCGTGVSVVTNNDPTKLVANKDPSGVILRNLRLSEIGAYGVQLDQYVNYAQLSNIYIESLKDGAVGLFVAPNSVGHTIEGVVGEKIQTAATLIRTNGILDRTTFPLDSWTSSKLRIGYYKNLDQDVHTTILNGASLTNLKPDGYALNHRDQDDTLVYESPSAGTWTIPFSSSYFAQGARLEVVNRGVGTLAIVPATGVVLGSKFGTVLAQNQAATLLKIGTNAWTLM